MSDEINRLKEEEKENVIYIEDDELLTVDTIDEKSLTVEERKERSNNWVGGAILIAIGSIFLLQNITSFTFNNWWALFILIPGFGSLINAWQNYNEDGRFSERARGPFIGGLILTFIASIFLFGWDWGTVWPIFLIIGGFGALMKGLLD